MCIHVLCMYMYIFTSVLTADAATQVTPEKQHTHESTCGSSPPRGSTLLQLRDDLLQLKSLFEQRVLDAQEFREGIYTYM